MAELLLVANPSKRRRKKASRRRKGRMPPALKAYWAAKRAGKAAPKKRRRRRAKARAYRVRRRRAIARSPRVRRRRHSVARVHHTRRRRNPHVRAYRRRRHRNPSLRSLTGAIMPTFKAGAWGAGGALTLDALWGLIYPRIATSLPSIAGFIANPYLGFLAKGVAAVGAGWVGGKVFRGRGRQMAEGAMTVVLHDFLRSTLQTMVPTVFGTGGAVPLSGYGSYLSGSAPILGTISSPQTYMPFNGMGAYLSGATGSSDDHGTWDGDLMGTDAWGGDYST